MRALPRTVLATLLALVALSGLAGSTALAAGGLSVTVPYPGVVVGPGSKVTFDVTIKTTTAGRVDLSLTGVPSGWSGYVRGGGTDITAVETNGKDAVSATVEITLVSSMPSRRATPSRIRWLAWWGMNQSTLATSTPASAAAAITASEMLTTAWRNTWLPCMRR